MSDDESKKKESKRSNQATWSPHLKNLSLSSRYSERQLRLLKETKAKIKDVASDVVDETQKFLDGESDNLEHSSNDLSPMEKTQARAMWQRSEEKTKEDRKHSDILSVLGSFLIHLMLKVLDIALIFAAGIFVWKALDATLFAPQYRSFRCRDLPGISHPFQDNTVSAKAVVMSAMLLPLVVIEVCEWFFVKAGLTHLGPIEGIAVQMANSTNIMLKYLLGFTLHAIVMQLGKCWVGRLRPNFISMCQPDWRAIGVDCSIEANSYEIITEAHCQGGEQWEIQGRGSFPSGHSSCAVFLATFVVLYTREISKMYHAANENATGRQQRRDDTRRKTKKIVHYLRRIIQPAIIVYAVFVCGSRIYDHWHNPTDVLGGSILGFAGAYLTFGMNTLQHALESRNFDI